MIYEDLLNKGTIRKIKPSSTQVRIRSALAKKGIHTAQSKMTVDCDWSFNAGMIMRKCVLAGVIMLAVLMIFMLPYALGQPTRKPTWTILVYGHADHSLSYQMVADIRKMESVGSSPGFHLVVQADFDASAEEDNEEEGLPRQLSHGTTRFLIAKSTDPELVTSRPVMRLPEMNHDAPRVLSDFITWAVKKYPADRFALVLWDHGGQWEGFGGDEQDGTVDKPKGMSTAAIRGALLAAMKTAGLKKWDFIAFDACLMGGMEVLSDFADLAEIFIACPEIDYGDGWHYGPVLQWLKDRPDADMRDFGRMEAAQWKALHFRKENEADRALAVHSVYDMGAFATVQKAWSGFAAALSAAYTPSNLVIPRQRRLSMEYSIEDIKSLGEATDYIDVGAFARRMEGDPKSPEYLKKAAFELIGAIDKMVIAKVLGSEKQAASGLSVWYPVDDEWEDGNKYPEYEKLSFSRQTPWPHFLRKANEIRKMQEDFPELEEPETSELTVRMGQPVKVTVDVTEGPGAFFLHGAVVDNRYGRKNDFVYFGEVISREIDGPGRYHATWDTRILTLLSDGGPPVYLGAFPKDAGGSIWVSYANYQRRPEARKRRVILITQIKADIARVLGLLDGTDDSAAPAQIRVRPGGVITPLYHVETRKGDDPNQWKKGFIESKASVPVPKGGLQNLSVAANPLPAGTYRLEIQVEDVYGYMSDVIEYDVTVEK
jgi:hypothetical protein